MLFTKQPVRACARAATAGAGARAPPFSAVTRRLRPSASWLRNFSGTSSGIRKRLWSSGGTVTPFAAASPLAREIVDVDVVVVLVQRVGVVGIIAGQGLVQGRGRLRPPAPPARQLAPFAPR